MMSGSCRRNARRRDREGEPRLFVHVDLVRSGSWISAGSSAVEMLTPGLVQDIEARVQRHGLAAAGRARDENHPVRAADRLDQRFLLVRLVAQRLDAELDAGRVEDTHHDLLAEQRRQRADPEVDRLRLRQHDLHPAVLRHALLRDVELGDHLDPRRELVLDHERRLRDLHQHAVEAVADPVVLLVRLEVDVRDPGLDRVDQDLLQVLDDRGVLDLGALLVPAGLRDVRFLEIDLQVLHRAHVLEQSAGRLDQLVDRLRELVVFDDDGLDRRDSS